MQVEGIVDKALEELADTLEKSVTPKARSSMSLAGGTLKARKRKPLALARKQQRKQLARGKGTRKREKMKDEHNVGWLSPAFKVLTAHGEAARESAQIKREHVLWLAPAFADSEMQDLNR